MSNEFEVFPPKAPLRGLQTSQSSEDAYGLPITFDEYPFRLNVPVGAQDMLLIMATLLSVAIWLIPMALSHMPQIKQARNLSRWIYKRYNIWSLIVFMLNWFIIGFVVLICPDWTMNEYFCYLFDFIWWWAKHLPKFIVSCGTLLALFIAVNYGSKVMHHFGFDTQDWVRFPTFFGLGAKGSVPIELFIWKVTDLESGGLKSNDVYVEVGLGDNQIQTTRVQHNVGTRSMIKQSMQLNFARTSKACMSLSVCDQQLVTGKEIGRISLSPQEIEDLCDSAHENWAYNEDHFIQLNLKPHGIIWIRIGHVTDEHVHAFETHVRESGFFSDPKVPDTGFDRMQTVME